MSLRITTGVQDLAAEVLSTMTASYGEDVIEDVFVAIEKDDKLMDRYRRLEMELSHDVVNNWMGRYTKELTGMQVLRQGVAAHRSRLVKTYSKLAYQA